MTPLQRFGLPVTAVTAKKPDRPLSAAGVGARPGRPAAPPGGRWALAGTRSRGRLVASFAKEGLTMTYEVGARVVAESESTERPARAGTVREVLREDPAPRYRIAWDDGHTTFYARAPGALHAERRAAEPTR